MEQEINKTKHPRIFLTTDEAADYFGIAKDYTLHLHSKRIIPYYKTHRKISNTIGIS